MFAWLPTALTAPLRDMVGRLAHSSVEFPDLQPVLTLFAIAILAIAIVGTLLAAASESDVYYALCAAGCLVAQVALVAGLVWSVPPEASELAAAFHAHWTFFTHISLVFTFAYRVLLLVLEGLLHILIAVSAILLRAVPIFALMNASLCLTVAWCQTMVKLYRFFQRLAGVLLQTFFPLPSLRYRFTPFDRTLLRGLLFTPLVTFEFPQHPDKWITHAHSTERIEPDTTPALEELVDVSVRYLHSALGPHWTSAHEARAIQSLGAVLLEVQARWALQKAEKQLEVAVLDAVLLWKAAKEGR
ncbi:hypothetical protein JCM8097_003474 [Rhodosporidiobolus ruineniae]